MTALFGTDGVRGEANAFLTPELAVAIARAAATRVRKRGRVIIGRDTRISGPMLEAALAAGFASAGLDVSLAGVIPTPAISFLIKDERATLGSVISASHNPPQDNGIKLFDSRGMKLAAEEEAKIERLVAQDLPPAETVGAIRPLEAAAARYASFLIGTIGVDGIDLSGMTIAADCAFGATGQIAPHVLRHLGARVIELNTAEDGRRINQGCGSTHLETIRAAVEASKADLGIAFDGDGDRVLLVTADGETIDGDRMIGIAALYMRKKGSLTPPLVVATIMSNLGLEETLARHGIGMIRTPVGDRNVSQEMAKQKAKLGGEQSGHIIFADHSPTGDGILTVVKLLEIAHDTGSDLAALAEGIKLYPQAHRNVPCLSPAEIAASPSLRDAVKEAEAALKGKGRVIVRPSGTQPVIRIMVEGDNERTCEGICSLLEDRIRKALP